GWPQPPFRQVWRWSNARWVARDISGRLPRRALVLSNIPEGNGPVAGSEKTPAAHGARQLVYLETSPHAPPSHTPASKTKRGNDFARLDDEARAVQGLRRSQHRRECAVQKGVAI